jgi:hypothetical protein
MPKELYFFDTINAVKVYDSNIGALNGNFYHSYNIYFPLKIIPMNYNDFMCVYFFYIYIGLLSNTIYRFKIHKETRKYNYALGFPIYDYLFGTYLSESQFSSIQQYHS